jgi:hypothetical protein
MQTDVSEVRAASIIRAMMEVVRTSETSVYYNETTRRNIPEGTNLQLFILLTECNVFHTVLTIHCDYFLKQY